MIPDQLNMQFLRGNAGKPNEIINAGSKPSVVVDGECDFVITGQVARDLSARTGGDRNRR